MTTESARQLAKQHPLQRLESPSQDVSGVFHTLGLTSFGYSFAYLVANPNPINESYGWHMQYLTIIGLSLATATFGCGLVADLTLSMQDHTLSRRMFKLKNILSVASAPMECLITLLYWSLRAIDPKLVLPDWAPPLPFLADLSFHAVPSVALVVDLLFFSPPYAIAFLPALALSGCIAFGYWFWIEQCYQHNQFYPYPLFEVLTLYQRIGLFAFSALLMALATALLAWLYNAVNGKHMEDLGNGDFNKREARSGNVKEE